MTDSRLASLTKALASLGIVGVSVPNWNDKTTWQIWREGSQAIKATSDAGISAVINSFDTSSPASSPLDGADIVTLGIAMNHENRIRALEKQSALNATQFKAAVMAVLSSSAI